jgi:hypothetical protein
MIRYRCNAQKEFTDKRDATWCPVDVFPYRSLITLSYSFHPIHIPPYYQRYHEACS